tara:strand:- start:149 stop:697 length:549 start_codon:yes stop_codon:yes gene_type:complete
MEALLENLKREIDFGGSGSAFKNVKSNTNVTVRSATTAHDLTATTGDLTVIYTGTIDGDVTLPQATAANAGMVIKIIYAAGASNTARKLGFVQSGGTTVLTGYLTIGALDAGAGDENISFAITNNAKVIAIDANDATSGGGAAGSTYTFTYYGANTVFVEGHGLVTTGTPAPDASSTSATGI